MEQKSEDLSGLLSFFLNYLENLFQWFQHSLPSMQAITNTVGVSSQLENISIASSMPNFSDLEHVRKVGEFKDY